MKKEYPILVAIIVFFVLAAGPILAGGKSEETEEAKTTVEGIHRGGTLVACMMAKVTSLDPPNGNAFSSDGIADFALYNRLLHQDESGSFVPELAESWEISEDGKQLLFHLHEGIVFHDGTPFNAEAAKFNLDRMLDPKEATQAYSFFTDMESVEIIDDYTIRLNMKRPSAVIFDALAYKGGFMISPAAYQKYGDDYSRHPVGTGPFKFVEWIPGNRVVVERNENYWETGEDGEPLPYLDQVILRIISDDSVRLAELQSGNAQLVTRIPDESMDIVENDPNLELVDPKLAICYRLYLNMRRPPFSNVKLRQAINYALDRETISKSLFPRQGYVAPFMIAPWDRNYSEYNPYSYNSEKAKQLMVEAGYPEGLDVEFLMISRQPDVTIAPVVQSYLKEIGVRTKILPLERLIYVDKTKNGDFDMAMAQMAVPQASLFLQFSKALHSEGPVNRAAWKNAEFDKLMEKYAVTFDPAKIEEIVHELQKICLDDAGQTFLIHKKFLHGKAKNVNGVIYEGEGTWRFTRTWLE